MSLAAEAAEPLAKGAEVTAECKEIAHYVEPPLFISRGSPVLPRDALIIPWHTLRFNAKI